MSSLIRPTEEFANTLSHGIGLLCALAATPVLIVTAARAGGAADVVGSSVFGTAMVLLYLSSTAYHATPAGPRKEALQRIDHAAIYVVIAGTYTPFTLGVLDGPWGWSLFGVVWGVAAAGVTAKLVSGPRYPRISTAVYLGMGWLVLVAAHPLVLNIAPRGLAWLVAGGILYSVGVVFYSKRDLAYGHFVWHLFVLAGSACHGIAVLRYAR